MKGSHPGSLGHVYLPVRGSRGCFEKRRTRKDPHRPEVLLAVVTNRTPSLNSCASESVREQHNDSDRLQLATILLLVVLGMYGS